MRLSANKDSPGYPAYSHSLHRRSVIKLDGKVMSHVITADTGAGFIERYETDASGDFVRDGDHVRTQRLSGKVEISFE